MKISKRTGRLKLDSKDTRIGNFIVSVEPEHVKIQDINSVYFIRYSKRMPMGIWLGNLLEMGEEGLNSIKTYIAVMWSLFSVSPDNELVQDILRAAENALKRHPDWYGYKMTDDDAENDKAAQEVKEMKEFEEEVKNLSGEE